LLARTRGPVLAAVAFILALVAGPGGITADSQRTLRLYNIHTKETLTAPYKRNGKYVPAEMAKVNWILRDWRKNEATTMDPELIDLLWEIHSELGSNEPIHIISGYRSRNTNELLRKTVGGQASQSRHILGKAADVHFPDVAVKNIRYAALIKERGGVGYYPTSNIPFVHVDIDRVRAWPRLPREELALLFPRGHTQHMPADGGPITRQDVIAARAGNRQLAVQLAAFHDARGRSKATFQTASLSGSLPKLLSTPRAAERPAIGHDDRAKLAALAGGALPQLVALPTPAVRPPRPGTVLAAYDPSADARPAPYYREPSVVAAPAFDEEHPDELSYRPFPVAPFLTVSASADVPVLTSLTHPDRAKVLETLGLVNLAPPLRLRPGPATAPRMLWAQAFKGEAVNLSALADSDVVAQITPPARRIARDQR
jgi:uncharacterized protein YcbK (DUF882 family)